MRKIHQLSSHMADLIAAGEVVERPMSVVKELLENSIDANATEIDVEIENGGISYIRICDNGDGMSKNDAPIAFLRHATSKILHEDDLLGIKTLGFRGEALAAISAVSKIDLFTKREDDKNGTFVSILAGDVHEIQENGCANGTTIIVRNLFYNVPARMKFLKKDYTEASYVTSIVQNLALSNPQIAFKYIKDGKIILKTTGNGQLSSVIYAIWGKEHVQNMIKVESFEIDGVTVSGYISKPHASKSTRGVQHFFVNGRYIKSRLIMSALEESYKNSIMHGKFPYCVLNISINEKKIDVNVHPTKMEIKFEKEKQIFNVVYVGCKNAIEQENIIVTQKNVKPVIPAPKPVFIQEEIFQNNIKTVEKIEISSETPIKTSDNNQDMLFSSISTYAKVENSNVNTRVFDIEFEDFEETEEIENTSEIEENDVKNTENSDFVNDFTEKTQENHEILKSVANPVKIIGDCFNTYILCEYKNEMILIDKHAAHERINFNKLLKDVKNISSQVLLIPKNIVIPASEYGIFIENLQEINDLGFNIEEFHEQSVIVREIPTILENEDIEDVILDIAHKLKYNKSLKISQLDEILHVIACKSAIKGNLYTNEKELENLALEVILNQEINYCPHGRPVKVSLTKNQIEKMFKRII